MKPALKSLAAALTLVLFATACGGSSDGDTASGGPNIVVQGEEALDSTPAPSSTTKPPDDFAGGATEGGSPDTGAADFDTTQDTIPQEEEEDPDSEFFDAVGEFMACLDTEGYRFEGVPSQGGDPDEPVNDPGYIEALTGCAARTQIVSKMNAAEDTSDLTADEIEEQNRGFTQFVDCLVGKGWTIPTPTPDENGVLQPPYIEIAQSWIPPDGSSLLDEGSLSGNDFATCGFDPNNPADTNAIAPEDS